MCCESHIFQENDIDGKLLYEAALYCLIMPDPSCTLCYSEQYQLMGISALYYVLEAPRCMHVNAFVMVYSPVHT